MRRRRRREHADVLGFQVCVALELVPGVVKRELRDLLDLVAHLEKAAGGLVAQIVKSQIGYFQKMAGTGKRCPYASGLVREDELARARL